jgi:hypothetical protein
MALLIRTRFRSANALAHANTLAWIVKSKATIFLDEITSAWLWDKMSVFGDESQQPWGDKLPIQLK